MLDRPSNREGPPRPPRGRRELQQALEVLNLPPVWRRSATEGRNPPKTTRRDVVAVAIFFALLLALLLFLASVGYLPFID
jgi:hypothetical protein